MLGLAVLAAPAPLPGDGLPVQLLPSDALADASAIEEIEATEPIAANYELGPEVRSFDVPLKWEHTTPISRANQTAAPWMTPDGGVIAEDTLISLALPGAGPRPSPAPGLGPGCTIKYTCDGEVPTSESSPYDAPFTLGKRGMRDQGRMSRYVMIGAVATCPGERPSPVNSRWFYVLTRLPPPIVVPTGIVRSCLPVRVNVSVPVPVAGDLGRQGAALRYAALLGSPPKPTPGEIRTETGCECELPFVYRGVSYDTCTEVDWPGNPWCYVQGETCGTAYFNRRFDRCAPFAPGGARMQPVHVVAAAASAAVALAEAPPGASPEPSPEASPAPKEPECPLLADGETLRGTDPGPPLPAGQVGGSTCFVVPPGRTAHVWAVSAPSDAQTPQLVASHPTEATLEVVCDPPPPPPSPPAPPVEPATAPAQAPETLVIVDLPPSPPPPATPPCTPPCPDGVAAQAPMPASYPDGGTLGASMRVRLYVDPLVPGGTIRYTTNGNVPTAASRKYTTPFYLTEDGQACMFSAEKLGSGRNDADTCTVTLKAITVPPPGSCQKPSGVFNSTFTLLAA